MAVETTRVQDKICEEGREKGENCIKIFFGLNSI